MTRVFGAELICSDEACPEVVEAVGTLEELDRLVCEGCGCVVQVTAIWEVDELRVVARPVELPLAA